MEPIRYGMARLAGGRPWLTVLIALIAFSGVHAITLNVSPPLWMDEVAIIDSGRVMGFEPGSDWALCWSGDHHRPLKFVYYLGGYVQEIAMRCSAPLPSGPRAASILGAMAASAAMIGWLSASGVPLGVSAGLGVAFFLDPLFVGCYRGGRVDSWAIGFCCASCWLIRLAANLAARREPFLRYVILGGAVTPLAFFFWPSSVLLYPAILVETLALARVLATGESGWPSCLKAAAVYTGCVLVSTALLLVPIRGDLSESFADLGLLLKLTKTPIGGPIEWELAARTLAYTPFLAAAALLAVVANILGRVHLAFSVTTLALTVYVLLSWFYPPRAVYLVPYYFLSVGLLLARFAARPGGLPRFITRAAVPVLLAWAVALLGARTAVALAEREQRDPALLLGLESQVVSSSPPRVYLGSWEPYEAGCASGWKMYRIIASRASEKLFPPRENLVRLDEEVDLDYAIFPAKDLDRELERTLESRGFCKAADYEPKYHHPTIVFNKLSTRFDHYVIYAKEGRGVGQR